MLELTMSPQISEITAALAKAQTAFPVVKKDSKAEIRSVKGNRDYHYASLGAVLDAIRGPLAAHGIAYTQPLEETPEGTFLVTLLLHTSGQWICSRFRIPRNDTTGAQDVGSYITYARRYSIAGVTGLAIEDDDGQAATRQTERQRPSAATSRPERPVPAREPGCDDDGKEPRRGKVRNAKWLIEAATKQGLIGEFLAIGEQLGYPDNLTDWNEDQVAGAIEARTARSAR